ncbi:MAG: hypothetical protein ACR2P0_08035 [Acidimicrobiales bacterium]
MTSVAYAVVRDDPPTVYAAESVDALQRLLALEVVARSAPTRLDDAARERMRKALLAERWADAVVEWIDTTGIAIDVYTHLHVYSELDLPNDLIGAQLQFSPLFRDE